jgi:predicted RNA-binding protein with PUA-like domain
MMGILPSVWHVLNNYENLNIKKIEMPNGDFIIIFASNNDSPAIVSIYESNKRVSIAFGESEPKIVKNVHPDELKALLEHKRIRLTMLMEG